MRYHRINVLLVGVALLFFLSDGAEAAPFGESDVVRLVNRDRRIAGLKELSWSETLADAAERKADDMARASYFSHTSPDGTRPWFFFGAAGYTYRFAGENLAIHFTNPELQESAWMESETHRANILSSRYTDIGIAVRDAVFLGVPTVITVQLFGAPAGVSTESDAGAFSESHTGSFKPLRPNRQEETPRVSEHDSLIEHSDTWIPRPNSPIDTRASTLSRAMSSDHFDDDAFQAVLNFLLALEIFSCALAVFLVLKRLLIFSVHRH